MAVQFGEGDKEQAGEVLLNGGPLKKADEFRYPGVCGSE